MPVIHSTAVVADGAELAEDVQVGPYCIIGPRVRIGAGCVLKSHVVIDHLTTIGERNTFYPFASIGSLTQDLKYDGGEPGVIIGDDNTFREYVTVSTATYEGDFTRIGSGCLFMACAHVAHDCIIGDRVIVANAGTLAGHVVVRDAAIIGGLVGIHQFVRLGELCILGGCSKAVQDVPPYMMCDGNPLRVRGINKVGLQRSGVGDESMRAVTDMYKILYRQNNVLADAVQAIRDGIPACPQRDVMLEFLEHKSDRGYTRT